MSVGLSLEGRRVVVVCGSGGVGKTTVSAAVAMALARSGSRTIVMAVDPSRRLATTLHLPKVPGERSVIDVGGGVELTALLLDTKRTFDELIERHAPSAERRDRIFGNRFYQRIAATLAGTHEYMAMERLYQLSTTEDWEAVVIDTPPTRSALAFLDAPRRLTDFLGGRMFRWLLWPYRRAGAVGMRGASIGARTLSRTIGRIAGSEALADIAEFLSAFEGMYDGFKERARAVYDLLAEEQTGFLIVTAPERASLGEAAHFVERLSVAQMHLSGIVVNRWRRAPSLEAASEVVDRLSAGKPEERAAAACFALAERLRQLEARGRSAVEAFGRAAPELDLTFVPELASDVAGREELNAVAASLFGPFGPSR
jgi:anion-transporting  ArsA/GET3 family ATPase